MAESLFVEAFAQEICGTIQGCCKPRNFPFDRARCESQTKEALERDLAKVRKTPGRVYDPQAGGNCIATYGSLFGQCLVGLSDDSVDQVCLNIYPGTLAEGQVCTSSRGCASGLECRAEGEDEARCRALPPPTPKGGKCSFLGECEPDSYCDGGTCVPFDVEGDPCTGYCHNDDLYCRADALGAKGVCRRPGGPGEECDNMSLSLSCASELKCDSSNHCVSNVYPISSYFCEKFEFDHL